MSLLWALAIQVVAYAAMVYRHRGFSLSPDGRRYIAMSQGRRVPRPYSRRWLLPALFGVDAWKWASSAAFIACGPLMYLLTGSLVCVWLFAWLPGMAINVRFPVLVDGVAIMLVLAAGVLYSWGLWGLAAISVFIAGQAKESSPVFALPLCPHPVVAISALASMGTAVVIGKRTSVPSDEPHILRPFHTALTKHDPLDWREMVLPWGSMAVLGLALVATGQNHTAAWYLACAALVVGYSQLIIANDSVRLYQWAAPAVLVALAPMQMEAWMYPVIAAHPFICGAAKRV